MNNKKRPSYVKAYQSWSTLFFTELISVPLTPVFAILRIHPNVITVLSLLLGLSTGVFFAFGYWITGAVVFELSFFCDNIDGKIARYRNLTSQFGTKLDSVADAVRKPSSLAGIMIFFLLHKQPVFATLIVLVLVAHVAVHKLFVLFKVGEYDLEFPEFHRKTIRRISPRWLCLYTFFDEQFIEFFVFPLIAGIIGIPDGAIWFFYGAILVTLLGLLKLIILINHRNKGRYEQVYQDWTGTKGNLDKIQ